LLAGLVVCGPCGCRMQTHYARTLRYACQRHALDYGMPACQSLVGEPLEQLVTEQILQVVTPAGLELSLRATEQCERERAAIEKQWLLNLERARQKTARVYRQYDAVEPDNRLVARTLERNWEEALLAERALEEDYARFRQTQPRRSTVAECAEIEALARNVPAIWQSPLNGMAEKRRVVRLLLERVVVWAPASSQEVTVHLHWSLGTVTYHRVRRPVGSWEQVAGAAAVRERVQAWQAAGWSSRRMAAELNAAGYQPPRGKSFTADSVRQLLARGGPGRTARESGQTTAAKRAAACRGRRGKKKRPECRSRAAAPDTVGQTLVNSGRGSKVAEARPSS
jgi:hypothetical protein